MDKQRNRNNRRKKQKIQAKRDYRPTPPTNVKESSQPRNIHSAITKSSSEDDDGDLYGMFDYVNQKLVQPESRFADNPEEDFTTTNDFEDLANATVSSSYFQFKSEKNWTEDISKYSELLAIDVKHLVAVSHCIPFNKFVEVDDRYFTKDQLTYFNSRAEQSKKLYQAELLENEKLLKLQEQNSENAVSNKKKSAVSESDRKQDDDLDFLLSLKEPEPLKVNPVNATLSSPKVNEEHKVSNNATNTKSIDLEKWLDSVLDL